MPPLTQALSARPLVWAGILGKGPGKAGRRLLCHVVTVLKAREEEADLILWEQVKRWHGRGLGLRTAMLMEGATVGSRFMSFFKNL